ncbi:DUF6415 family natural product biosynthesis protein [Streptomyces sp. NPDC094149]|uniref:DUF6415 family natural product biosynthesis protein n=1 Tax=Streptomyces sp. NPDC094149 TaxID=3155079 RepID=UPI00332CA127
MRETVARALALAAPPTVEAIGLLVDVLRGHTELMVREVEPRALDQAGELPGALALACVGEARRKLGIEPRSAVSSQLAYGRRLARVLKALCDHHERLKP